MSEHYDSAGWFAQSTQDELTRTRQALREANGAIQKMGRQFTAVMDVVESIPCSCNQHIICTVCIIKMKVQDELKEDF